MVKVEKIEHIRLLLRDGHSIRRICRELGVSKRIVRRAKQGPEPKRYTRPDPRLAPRLGPHKAWIDQILADDRDRPRKQRHTAQRIYDRLVAEHGFAGDASTVRRYVAAVKRRQGQAPPVFVPLNHPPGRDAEVDWGQRPVVIGGEGVTAQILVMRACFSGLPFVRAYPTQRQEAFFDGMQEACRFFGGVFHRWTFDNLTQAVKKVLRGRTRQEQEAFSLFRSHLLFDPLFTLAGIEGAHEKGGVEGAVGYVARNWFVPTPQFDSWEDLNAWLLNQCRRQSARDRERQR
jgi:transposase